MTQRKSGQTIQGAPERPPRRGRAATASATPAVPSASTEALFRTPGNKYGARRTWVEAIGRHFASKREAEAALALWARQQAGEIQGLAFQPRYPLDVDGTVVGFYVADFEWREWNAALRCWDRTVADAKGVRTPVYRLKAKLMFALYGITIVEL